MLEHQLGQVEDRVRIIMGDFNARVGRQRGGVEDVIGPFGDHFRNEEGVNMIDFCARKRLKIMNGFYQHRDSNIHTRYRWNANTEQFDKRSVIDYFLSSDKRLATDVKVFPGVSLDSDHRLLVMNMKIAAEKSSS